MGVGVEAGCGAPGQGGADGVAGLWPPGTLPCAPQGLTSHFQRHDEVLTELDEATRRCRKLELLCREFELQQVCYLPLNAFLLKPLQRLVHYRLLLSRLCQHHPPGHRDHADCRGEWSAGASRLVHHRAAQWSGPPLAWASSQPLEMGRGEQATAGGGPSACPTTRRPFPAQVSTAQSMGVGPPGWVLDRAASCCPGPQNHQRCTAIHPTAWPVSCGCSWKP